MGDWGHQKGWLVNLRFICFLVYVVEFVFMLFLFYNLGYICFLTFPRINMCPLAWDRGLQLRY